MIIIKKNNDLTRVQIGVIIVIAGLGILCGLGGVNYLLHGNLTNLNGGFDLNHITDNISYGNFKEGFLSILGLNRTTDNISNSDDSGDRIVPVINNTNNTNNTPSPESKSKLIGVDTAKAIASNYVGEKSFYVGQVKLGKSDGHEVYLCYIMDYNQNDKVVYCIVIDAYTGANLGGC
jgi:uncharacterized membrane protein YkoI